jgi:hypothetical protein
MPRELCKIPYLQADIKERNLEWLEQAVGMDQRRVTEEYVERRPQVEGNREGPDGDGRKMQRMIYES